MSVWFEGRSDIDCDLDRVQRAFDDLGGHYVGVVGLMPGIASVELVDQGSDSVTIKTNEGLMQRTNITKRAEADRVVVEFDEAYEAGSKVTVISHISDEFTIKGNGVAHHMVISNVEAPGLMGFFYRTFGSAKIGNAFLTAYKTYFENRSR